MGGHTVDPGKLMNNDVTRKKRTGKDKDAVFEEM